MAHGIFLYICFTNIGCGSAMASQKTSFFLAIVLTFHYICPWYGGRKAANRRVKDGKLHDEMPSFRSQKTAFYISICNRLKVKKLWNDAEINGLLL